jgi:hypothetical protein
MKFQLLAAYYSGFMPTTLPNSGGAAPGPAFQGFQIVGAYMNGGLSLGHQWFVKWGAQSALWFVSGMRSSIEQYPFTMWISTFIGILFTYGMMIARSRFAGFPLHPIGYLMSLNWAGRTLWFSIFLGWLFKVLITRFGGHDTYRKFVLFLWELSWATSR